MTRALRYLAPNLITATGIIFGLLSMVASMEGRYYAAGWLVIYCSLTDRLDGVVARAVRGTSELGVQLDSLADLITFGLAPATLMVTALGRAEDLPFHEGGGRLFLLFAAAVWVLSSCFRLARYNITAEVDNRKPVIFFGVPTTLAAGTMVIWFLAFLKYAPPGAPVQPHATIRDAHLLGDSLHTPDAVWMAFPVLLVVGGLLMASSLRMPKLGLARSKVASAFVLGNVAAGSLCGILNVYPEYMVLPPTMWLVTFLVWGQVSKTAREMKPPPIFPAADPPPGEEPLRPEDDIVEPGEIPNDEFQI